MQIVIRTIFVISALWIMASQAEAHELLMARFNIVDADNGYRLDIRLDRENMLYTLQQECSLTGTETSQRIIYYIYDHFFLNIDGQDTDYEIEQVQFEENFVILKGHLVRERSDFNQIEVHNTCMIDSIEKHTNIIGIKAKGRTRSFRLDKDRKMTVITY